MPTLSVVTTSFNERENLPIFYDRLVRALPNCDWEWLVVDDHSTDDSLEYLTQLHKSDPRVKAIRLSKNMGSHRAALAGLLESRSECTIVMAADLQDPPEQIPELLKSWKQGYQIVWMRRSHRPDQNRLSKMLSNISHRVFQRLAELPKEAAEGADFFLVDRHVIKALSCFKEGQFNILSLLAWMGFRQTYLSTPKQLRVHGQSKWTLRRKIKLFTDTLMSFSPLPIRIMTFAGCFIAVLGFLWASLIIYWKMEGRILEGWTSIMTTILFLGGSQMIMLGILGEYLWRCLEETRNRPRYMIEQAIGNELELREVRPIEPIKNMELSAC